MTMLTYIAYYLLWFFVGGKPERDIAAIVGAAYSEPTQGTR
jgi:hypothetical protein